MTGRTRLLCVEDFELREELIAPFVVIRGIVDLDDSDDERVVHKLEIVEHWHGTATARHGGEKVKIERMATRRIGEAATRAERGGRRGV